MYIYAQFFFTWKSLKTNDIVQYTYKNDICDAHAIAQMPPDTYKILII